MKLIFKKDEDSNIGVSMQIDDNEQTEFSYIDMVKALISSKKMEDAELCGEFTEAEIKSIKTMVAFINKELSEPKDSKLSS